MWLNLFFFFFFHERRVTSLHRITNYGSKRDWDVERDENIEQNNENDTHIRHQSI